tara:strand:+ start:167 stop:412 length:246 start_codon:yes stop_codon:yes gene_type:complete
VLAVIDFMDSRNHPRRLKISQLYEQMKVLEEQTLQVLKEIGRQEKDARFACADECPPEDKWTRENHSYSELYCRHCGANKR